MLEKNGEIWHNTVDEKNISDKNAFFFMFKFSFISHDRPFYILDNSFIMIKVQVVGTNWVWVNHWFVCAVSGPLWDYSSHHCPLIVHVQNRLSVVISTYYHFSIHWFVHFIYNHVFFKLIWNFATFWAKCHPVYILMGAWPLCTSRQFGIKKSIIHLFYSFVIFIVLKSYGNSKSCCILESKRIWINMPISNR